MKRTYDLSQLDWQLAGFVPEQWRFDKLGDIAASAFSDVPAISAPVPGSVQAALREAGIIPDWNVGLDARQCEWVENRQWVYQVKLPAKWLKNSGQVRLRCAGLDYNGWVYVNGHEVGAFQGSFVPHTFDLSPHLRARNNLLQIIFDVPPRWLGQFGHTSRITEWKPRFNYTWDWTSRLVQIGIWDAITLEAIDGAEIESLRCVTEVDAATGLGSVRVDGVMRGAVECMVEVTVEGSAGVIRAESRPIDDSPFVISLEQLPVEPWQPNGLGSQPLYTVRCRLFGPDGRIHDEQVRTVGFKHVEWRPCEGAPAGADPWICVVNGQPIFLQGVNWTPIRPNFADVPEAEYRKRLELYRDLGCNLLRVWGGAYLEKECFYRICDELGLLVWQEFPLSSSGVDNWPPEDERSIAEMADIAASYIERRQHHASLLLWCGGNELQGGLDGSKAGVGKPVDASHPLIGRTGAGRRRARSGPALPAHILLRPTLRGARRRLRQGACTGMSTARGSCPARWPNGSSIGPATTRSSAPRRARPAPAPPRSSAAPRATWPRCPARPTIRSGGAPVGGSSGRSSSQEQGREPASLEEFVAWSQARQAEALVIAARACKGRFPRCGGFIIWMGHDSFPCTANTAIVDFDGEPKPAALALREVFRNQALQNQVGPPDRQICASS